MRRNVRKKTYKKPYKKVYKKRINFTKAVRKVLDKTAERKYIDNQFNGTVSALGITEDLDLGTNITVGDTQFQRIGTNIDLRCLQIKGIVWIPNAVSPQWLSATVRIAVVQWYLPPPLIVSNVFYNQSVSGFTINSQYRKETSGQYKILYDRKHVVNVNGTATKSFYIKLFGKRLGKKRIQFTNPGSPSVVNTNNIYIFMISDISSANLPPAVDFETRLSFVDV